MSGYLYKDFINYVYNSPLILLTYALLFSFIVCYVNKNKVKSILYIIVLSTITALTLCLYTNNLLYLFIGIEAYNILFILLLYNTCNNYEFLLEIKKLLLLSMVISSIMAFGNTLVLLANNNLYFKNINLNNQITIFGLLFVLIGILFKLCVFPFHIWILDIYKKSPYYIVLISDCFLKIVLLRVLLNFMTQLHTNIFDNIFLILGTISMFLGLIISIRENNIKRFLGLFNISHIGLILLLISTNNINYYISVFGYLLMYSTCSLVFILSIKDKINDFRYFITKNNTNQKQINNYKHLQNDNISTLLSQERHEKVNNCKYFKNTINSIISIISLIAMMCIPPFHTFLSKVDLISIVLKDSRYIVLIIIIMYFILEMVVILIKIKDFIKYI